MAVRRAWGWFWIDDRNAPRRPYGRRDRRRNGHAGVVDGRLGDRPIRRAPAGPRARATRPARAGGTPAARGDSRLPTPLRAEPAADVDLRPRDTAFPQNQRY